MMLSKRKCSAFIIYALQEQRLGILQVVVDTPERSVQKGSQSSNGFYGCQTCTNKAERVKSHSGKGTVNVWIPKYIGKGKKRKVKPCLYRSHEKTLQVLRKRVAGPRKSNEGAYHYSVKGNFYRSPFELDRRFNLVVGFTYDDFHMYGAGVVKRIMDTIMNPFNSMTQYSVAKARLWQPNEVSRTRFPIILPKVKSKLSIHQIYRFFVTLFVIISQIHIFQWYNYEHII